MNSQASGKFPARDRGLGMPSCRAVHLDGCRTVIDGWTLNELVQSNYMNNEKNFGLLLFDIVRL